MTQTVRVLLVEDHTIVREGLKALLTATEDLEVVGEVADGRAAVEAAERLAPDVVVMDINMPKLDGVGATREIREKVNAPRVLILSMYDGEEYVRPAIRAGASGYLLKGSGLSDLVTAIREVAGGNAFFSPTVAKILLQESRGERSVKEAPDPADSLTKREREVLTLVGEGKSSPEIAKILGLSVKTIEGHRGRIMAKLGVHNVAGLVRQAIRIGLVSAEH
ncbi:two component transcriptional regulator, LuxR family protein [Plesiocystis pacifica SIR-1]|uniref:Two component transcriptional regulator, LuxR family protein n=1 Tax=Plesiocystis pacifica SIR-1 TaxID=391625 RepID=A6GFX0_9BACT|nr:response regulator transcription factor [Plesiocystis pacifica]EDM75215.1 two component transcriptional regulator, LuxR family protein [Plesiocystis pacifica SIR-1]